MSTNLNLVPGDAPHLLYCLDVDEWSAICVDVDEHDPGDCQSVFDGFAEQYCIV